MDPPAPVTRTVLFRISCAMPPSSSSTGSRPSRSSGSMLRTRSMRAVPSRSSLIEGTVSTGRPVAAAKSMTRRLAAIGAPGIATMTWVAPARMSSRRRSSIVPTTGTPAMRASRLTGSSSSRPSTIQPSWWIEASKRLAAPPAPSTMARRTWVSLPVIRARRCS